MIAHTGTKVAEHGEEGLPVSSRRELAKIGTAILAFVLACNVVGYGIGFLNSPDYNSELGSFQFLISDVKYIVSDDSFDGLQLTAGPYVYDYFVKEDALVKKLREAPEILRIRPPKRGAIDEVIRTGKWLGITTAVPGGAIGAGVAFAKEVKDPSLWKIARGAGRFWSARVVLLLTIGGSAAGYLGYYIGYNDEQDYENSTFLSVIGEKVYYQSIAKYFKVCESLAHLIHRNIIQDMSAKAKIAMPDNSRVIYVARGRDDDVGLNNRELKKKKDEQPEIDYEALFRTLNEDTTLQMSEQLRIEIEKRRNLLKEYREYCSSIAGWAQEENGWF